jgi:glucose-6-phosphate 1-dehydrogenase
MEAESANSVEDGGILKTGFVMAHPASRQAIPPQTGVTTAPQACALVIFGGGGDLARRKLIPALYNLEIDGLLPETFIVLGVARTGRTDQAYRAFLREGIESFSRQALDETRWQRFAERLFYLDGTYGEAATFAALKQRLEALEGRAGLAGDRIFYLSIPPSGIESVVMGLARAGLIRSDRSQPPFSRVIVEKPIGHDLASARAINATLSTVFDERQVFRIDHYLGKETVQNIMVMRFANSFLEPLWNHKYIDHVQITVAEDQGVGTRGSYYEESGALRDMVQNHLLQLLSLTAMEPPWSLAADVVREHKLEVLECLRPITPTDVDRRAVRAQYAAGAIDGTPVPGYRREPGVAPDSTTETYVALELFVDNWRWSGVPFYVRTGKRLPRRTSEIAVQFRPVPQVLFNADAANPLPPNTLVLRLQPNEGLTLNVSAKKPGARVRVEPVEMAFSYAQTFGRESPEAYERLLLDVMAGDASLFMRGDAVEASWRFIDGILDAWRARKATYLPEYRPGSGGPVEADRMIEADGRRWRRL